MEKVSMIIQSYDLEIDVDFRDALIRGRVTIHISDADDHLDLDAEEITVVSASVDEKKIPFEHDTVNGLLHLSHLPKSKEVAITLEYEKKVSDEASTGVYKAHYGAEYFISTDFEPDRARTFFPCKDDPSWKAVFNLRVVTDSELRVISNSPLNRIEDTADPSKKRFVFDPTPKMSTYLLYMGVGRFAEVSAHRPSEDGPAIIVASRPGTSDKCEFILDIASNVLRESGRYYGIPYPLKKLHLLGIPEMGGAMENWGAITSYEGAVLVDKTSSGLDRRRAATTTAHEIQHQWFGDLVTMKWWDDIWLNESFASFMSYKIVDKLHPEWNCWSDFLSTMSFGSMSIDQLRATHPVQAKVRRPAEIHELFDSISYGKGASILRMVEAFLGEETFRTGVSDYIKRFSYSNATSDDLWMSLGKVSARPVFEIMSAWGRRCGFPLVSVDRVGRKLVFQQRRFLLSGREDQEDTLPWPIPITMQINGKLTKFLLDERTKEIGIDSGELLQLKVNSGQTGYYCVKYGDSIYEMLATQFASLNGLDKAGLINDLFQLLKAGEVGQDTYFRFVRLCESIEDYTTALTVLLQLRVLNSIAEKSRELHGVSCDFLNSQMDRLTVWGREGEQATDGILRGRMAFTLAMLDNNFAHKIVERFADYQSVGPEMRAAVAAAYVRTTGREAFHTIVEMILGSESEVEREKLYLGLAALDDPSLIGKAIEFSASGKMSRGDIHYTLPYMSWNPRAHQTIWDWIKNNFDMLWELGGQPAFVLALLHSVIPLSAVGNEADAINFFSGNRLLRGETSFKQDLELLSVYSRLHERLR